MLITKQTKRRRTIQLKRQLRFEVLEGRHLLSGTGVLEQFPPLSGLTEIHEEDHYGAVMASDGNVMVIGATGGYGRSSGAAYVMERVDGEWVVQAKLSAKLGQQLFGATLAVDGDTVIVGAFAEDLPGAKYSAGAVYVFRRSGPQWIEEARLTASDAARNDEFGRSIAIEGDTLLIGSFNRGFVEEPNAGAVYVYRRTGSMWAETALLHADEPFNGGAFGSAVAMDDGLVAIATRVEGPNDTYPYEVYVYSHAAGVLTRTATLSTGDALGSSLAIAGNTIVAGMPYYDQGLNLIDSGGAYVFALQNDQWSDGQLLAPSDSGQFAYFGNTVDIDGDVLVVGAYGEVHGNYTGAAYRFQRTSDGNWLEQERFQGLTTEAGDSFGRSVLVHGSEILVGAPNKDSEVIDSGLVHRFQIVDNDTDVALAAFKHISKEQMKIEYAAQEAGLGFRIAVYRSADEFFDPGDLSFLIAQHDIATGNGIGDFTFQAGPYNAARPYLVALAITDIAEYTLDNNQQVLRQVEPLELIERFPALTPAISANVIGYGRTLAVDGKWAVVGAPSFLNAVGAVYVLENVDGTWIERAMLRADEGAALDAFGNDVAISGETIVIGAPFESSRAQSAGAAYVFRYADGLWKREAKLTASDAATNDNFGSAVSIEAGVVVIGASRKNARVGAAYVFNWIDGNWTETATLSETSIYGPGEFGAEVTVDQHRIFISAPKVNAVYVFNWIDEKWTRTAELRTESSGPYFGRSIAVEGDLLAVSSGEGSDRQHIHIFRYEHLWTVEHVLAEDSTDYIRDFGISLALDDNRLLIGTSTSYRSPTIPGSVHLYQRSNDGYWIHETEFTSIVAAVPDYFGDDVAIAGDSILVGAYGSPSSTNPSGAVYSFEIVEDNTDFAITQAKHTSANSLEVEYAAQGDVAEVQPTVYRSTDEVFDVGDLAFPVRSETFPIGGKKGRFSLDPGGFDFDRPHLIVVATTSIVENTYSNNLRVLRNLDRPGDYNNDFVVDGLDHAVWRAGYGSNQTLVADGNQDGVVNTADYIVWRRNMGRAYASAPPLSALSESSTTYSADEVQDAYIRPAMSKIAPVATPVASLDVSNLQMPRTDGKSSDGPRKSRTLPIRSLQREHDSAVELLSMRMHAFKEGVFGNGREGNALSAALVLREDVETCDEILSLELAFAALNLAEYFTIPDRPR